MNNSSWVNATLYGTLSWLEAIWLVIIIVGIYYHIKGLSRAREDKKFLGQASLNGRRLFIANEHIYNEAVRLTVQLWFFWLGFTGAFAPTPSNQQLRLGDYIFIITFFFIAIAFDALSIYSDFNRKRLLKYPSGS